MSKGNGNGMYCPNCGGRAHLRRTKQMSDCTRERLYVCSNIEGEKPCGMSFVAIEEVQRMVVPPAIKTPGKVTLPMSHCAQRLYGNKDASASI
ncbi:ogr/Delta-like zinc finger family protein [Shewanella dokdonensis]|uniref:Ogr/Delta-like zinc finger family protein n=1 Tax=Shewanella dokdonensis TaxID=712036 RepID=A0ABX8DBI5_9GAMM|nr:ogr/Delta-like zinc finger family protein [Shewanella dokdonensis]